MEIEEEKVSQGMRKSKVCCTSAYAESVAGGLAVSNIHGIIISSVKTPMADPEKSTIWHGQRGSSSSRQHCLLHPWLVPYHVSILC